MGYDNSKDWKFLSGDFWEKLTFSEKKKIDDPLITYSKVISERMLDYLDILEKSQNALSYEEQKRFQSKVDDLVQEVYDAFKGIKKLKGLEGLEAYQKNISCVSRNAISDAFEKFINLLELPYRLNEEDGDRLRTVYIEYFWPLIEGEELEKRHLEVKIRNFGVECYVIKERNKNGS
jgi:hypothetical protein